MDPRSTLTAFDRYLADRGLTLEAVVVGGAALNLLGVITRQTARLRHPAPGSSVRDPGRRRGLRGRGQCERRGAEGREAVAWLEPQDLNPHWPAHVRSTLGDLARRLGNGP